jgi:hypothetical protein
VSVSARREHRFLRDGERLGGQSTVGAPEEDSIGGEESGIPCVDASSAFDEILATGQDEPGCGILMRRDIDRWRIAVAERA